MIRALTFAVLLVILPIRPPVASLGPPAIAARSSAKEERKAKKKLERIKPLSNAGKYKTARRRLRKLIRNYPGTVAALQAHIILGTLED